MAKAKKEVKKDQWLAFAYANGTGDPKKVDNKKAYDALLNSGYSDCPAKAKKAKAKS